MNEAGNTLAIFLSLRGKLARAITGIVPPKEVEDIVQETYVRVCQAERSALIRTPQSFMYRTARNLALDHVRSAAYRLSDRVDDDHGHERAGVVEMSDTTFGKAASTEEFGRFCEAVRSLPTQCRRVFVLKKVYGYSQREIAKATGLSENTIEKHIAKGIRRCRDFMLQYAETPADAGRQDRERTSAGRWVPGKERGR